MKFILTIIFLVLLYSHSLAMQDSIPEVKDIIVAKSSLKVSYENPRKEEAKYTFKPIYTGKYNSKKIGENSVIQSFYGQATSNLHYNLNLEAHNYISSFRNKNQNELLRMKSWGAYYLSSMESILIQNGIPKQLVYLAVIETHLDVNLVSWAGAAGMWQFMPETGRMYGLQVSGGYDERFNWQRSTYAAAAYLKDLYKNFNDWLLVVAAYNGGPGRVYSAIKRSGSRDFWALQYYLPKESSNHVKKFIATQYIMDGSTAIASINSNQIEKPKKFFNPLEKGAVAVDTTKNMESKKISGRYNSLIIAKYILMDIATFNIINPNFDTDVAKEKSEYNLRLPKDKMDLFSANHLQIMNESLQLFLTLNNVYNTDPTTTSPVLPVIKKRKSKY